MNRILYFLLFALGLAIVCWVGVGYVALSPLALAVTAIIALVYVLGAFELYRYQQATYTLQRAVRGLTETPAALADWLSGLDPSLREPVRLRVEGERVGLPGPSLTPYLVGLLVLLGMLGTFLGMVATLRGTGLALESATDLQAIRASLAAPVKGLGFAFGTSVAGVATSAMLGLLSALCRRDRTHAVRELDVKAGSILRVFSQAHQREESFRLMQQQAQALPAVADRLQAMMAALEQHNQALTEKLLAGQEAAQAKHEATHAVLQEQGQALSQQLAASTEAAYLKLATSVGDALKESVSESARAAGSVLQPAVESTFETLVNENKALHETIRHSVQEQLAALSQGFEQTTLKTGQNMADMASLWSEALREHQQASQVLVQTQQEQGESLIQAQRSVAESLATDMRGSLETLEASFEQRASGLVDALAQRLDKVTQEVAGGLHEAVLRQQTAGKQLADDNQQALASVVTAFEQQASSLVRTVDESHQGLKEALAAQDSERLTAWAEAFGGMTTTLREEWQQSAEVTASRQKEICDVLAQTAADIARQTREHSASTIAEIEQLVQAAAEAPKVAAQVVAEVRDKLSDSMARDNAMLEERGRMLETLSTLLDAVNHASNEQRTAVDALLSNSSSLLDRIGTQVSDKVQAEAGKLEQAASEVAGSIVDIAGLGDVFGKAVQQFSDSNATLSEHLQRVEEALDKSLQRSDDQLAYYVAQAREVIDLSMLSQKQILEELQHVGPRTGNAGAAT